MAVKLASLTGHPLLRRNIFIPVTGTRSLYRLSKLQGLVRLLGFGNLVTITDTIGSQTRYHPDSNILPPIRILRPTSCSDQTTTGDCKDNWKLNAYKIINVIVLFPFIAFQEPHCVTSQKIPFFIAFKVQFASFS
jgi:hypothetical protein